MIEHTLAAMPYLIRGAVVTLEIAALASILGFFGGTILGFLHNSKNSLISWLVTGYVTLLRGTPMLIQISCAYYLLPAIGINVGAFTTAVIAIGLNSAAYISQIMRSGIGSVAKGQIEAAQVLGLSHSQTMYYVIFPQAIRLVIPALLNEFITLIKDSSLASTIGVVELFKEGTIIMSRTYIYMPIYLGIALIYLFLTSTLTLLISLVNKRFNIHADH